jgi:dienelactone hydrolase
VAVSAELSGFPDPLIDGDGRPVGDVEGWAARRTELLGLFERHVYGYGPPDPRSAPAPTVRPADGDARELSQHYQDPDCTVSVLLMLPSETERPPGCVLVLNLLGNRAVFEPVNGRRLLGATEALARGWAYATVCVGDVVPDDAGPAAARLAALWPTYREGESGTATLMAWAWTASRALELLVAGGQVDPNRIAVTGHSRLGKTALLAAAFDERFALALPAQSGCGGAAPSRQSEWAAAHSESVAAITSRFPHWFCPAYAAAGANPADLPVDQHELLALCAPRPVLLSNGTEDLWADPPGQRDMLRAADPVYRLVAGSGLAGELGEQPGVSSGRLGSYLRPGGHSVTSEDWSAWLDYLQRWLP